MNKLILSMLLALSLSLPAVAQNNIDSRPAVKTAPVLMEDGSIKQMVIAEKQPFALRHPKLHKTGRKIRRTCQILQPIVSFGGSCAQIVRLFY